MLILRPYIKSEWRKNIGDLVADEEKKKFEWWLCGQPFNDSSGDYFLLLPNGLSLFNEETGESYRVVKTPEQPKVYIVNHLSLLSMKKALKNGAIGIAFLSQRKECVKCDESIVCYEAIVALPKECVGQSLEPINDYRRNKIVSFSLRNNVNIRKVMKNFPDCKEIRSVIEYGYSLHVITKVLYEYLLVYFGE